MPSLPWNRVAPHLLAAVLTWIVAAVLSSILHIAAVNLLFEPPPDGRNLDAITLTLTALYIIFVSLVAGAVYAPLALLIGLPIWYLGFRLLRPTGWSDAKKAACIAGLAWSPIFFVLAALSVPESNYLWSWYLCGAIAVLIAAPANAWMTHKKHS